MIPSGLRLLLTLLLACCTSMAHAASHALTLYGEAPKYPAGFTHLNYVNPDAPKGGTLRLAGYESFDSLNPFIPRGTTVDQIGLVYDTLTYQTQDEPFSVYGLVARRMERSADNSWVRFYLDPRARFNDGTPITAEDVVFSFETLRDKGIPLYRSYYADVKNIVVENPHQVRFDFSHNENRELPLILGSLPLLPKHWWQGRDFADPTLEPPLGSGPYRVTRIQPGRGITYERVRDWWAKDLPITRGMYNFDHVIVDYYQDMSVALEAFKAGYYDFRQEYSAKDWATGYDSPALSDGRIARLTIPNHNPVGMQGFAFNIRRPKFQDPRVRQAIGLLFDFEWTNRQLFFGNYKRISSYFENSEMAAHDLPSPEELKLLEPFRSQLPPQVFTEVFQPPTTDGSGLIIDNMRKAYQLLQSAGYRIRDDRMVDGDGQPLTFEFLLFQSNMERVLLPFKRNLAELGIDMEIRRVDLSQFINRLQSKDFDMVSAIWSQSSSPGNEQREFWHSASADKPNTRNYVGIRNPVVDHLVEELVRTDSRANLITHIKALDRVLQWNYYVVPNYYINTWRIAYSNRLEHPKTFPDYDIGLMTWWARPEKADSSLGKR